MNNPFIEKLIALFQTSFSNLWNWGGLLGRGLAIIFGLIGGLLLLLAILLKLSFLWSYRIFKVFLGELRDFLLYSLQLLEGANELLEGYLRDRVWYWLQHLLAYLLGRTIDLERQSIPAFWWLKAIGKSLGAFLIGIGCLIFGLITFAPLWYFLGDYALEWYQTDWLISLGLKLTIFTPILVRMIRRGTWELKRPSFWRSDTAEAIPFRKRHIAYVLVAGLTLTLLFISRWNLLVVFP